MRKVETRLDEATIARIEASGKSVYEFLQEAVACKLENDRVLQIDEMLLKNQKAIRAEIVNMFTEKLDHVEERMLAVLNAQQKISTQKLDEAKEIITNSLEPHDLFRANVSAALQKIATHIKG